MKTKFYFTAIILLVFQFTFAQQNQSPSGINPNSFSPVALPPSTTEVFRFLPGLVTQIDKGSTFDFTTANQWFSLGNLTPHFVLNHCMVFEYKERDVA